MSTVQEVVAATIRDVPDFPQPGVLFKDFTPLLSDGAALVQVIDDIARHGIEAALKAGGKDNTMNQFG